MGASANEIFAAMEAAIVSDPTLVAKFNASVVFCLDCEHPFRLDATKGEPKENAELTVTTTLDVFHQLLAKKLSPQQAFMQGKLKIKGNMGLAMKLSLVLNSTRKHLQARQSRL